MKPINVGPLSRAIAAPPELVYQMLSAIGQGSQRNGERSQVLERNGDELICDFWTPLRLPGGAEHVVRTRERVTLRPPDQLTYEHLDGPVRGLRESITVTAGPEGGCAITYAGTYVPRSRLDELRVRLLAVPAIKHVIAAHFDDFRRRAEDRAQRSRVFPRRPSAGAAT